MKSIRCVLRASCPGSTLWSGFLVGFLLAARFARFQVDRLGDLGEFAIRFFFFLESLAKQRNGFLFPRKFSEFPHGAVGGDFVVLNALSGSDNGRIEHSALVALSERFVSFTENSLHTLAFLAFDAFAQGLEDLLDPLGVFPLLARGASQFPTSTRRIRPF